MRELKSSEFSEKRHDVTQSQRDAPHTVQMAKVREYEAGMLAVVKPAAVAAAHFKSADRSDEAVRRRQHDQVPKQ